MSGFDVAAYMIGILVWCAIAVGISMIPAYLLVITHRSGGRLALFAAAAFLSVALSYFYLHWVYDDPDWELYGNYFAWTALALGSMTAAIVAGIGREGIWQQTAAAASAALFVPAIILLLGLVVFARGVERWMAAGGVALAAYLLFRHWQTRHKAANHG